MDKLVGEFMDSVTTLRARLTTREERIVTLGARSTEQERRNVEMEAKNP